MDGEKCERFVDKGALVRPAFAVGGERTLSLSLSAQFLILFRQPLTFEEGRVVSNLQAGLCCTRGKWSKAQRTSEGETTVIGHSKKVIVTARGTIKGKSFQNSEE